MKLNISQNRKARKYSKKEIGLRLLWVLGRFYFKLTPRPFFAGRRFILRLFGAKIGKNVHIYPSTNIFFPWNLDIGDWSAIGEMTLIYNLGPVIIGERATISHKAHICAGTHDYTKAELPLQKPTIVIEDQVWVAADSFVGPGVTIGQGAVVGARAAVFKNVAPWTVVGGNPANFIKMREIKD
ncbi:hypothetical protein [uncultured Draconibacterium sp.]|uniref:hypothetical protein n=1 Tax=uncultured Draconibacterium sp. TaxID=1573823 RepID=UPI003260B933